jgi:precorrin-6B methylase 2
MHTTFAENTPAAGGEATSNAPGFGQANLAIESEAAASRSPDGIMQLAWGFRSAKVLLSAVELDLFTELAGGPLDADTLRQRLGLHERGALDFLDALVALGMLRRHGAFYTNTPEASAYLDRRKPAYIGGLLQLANTMIYANWSRLTDALLSGEPQSGVTESEDLFDMLYDDEAGAAAFAEGMTGASLPSAWALARRFTWREYQTFVDIGTAEGAVPVALAKAHPHLMGGGFDLPRAQPLFDRYVERHGLSERLRFHAGDFFRDPLPSADVLVMGQILHDWDLESKRRLLAKAHATLPQGGVLIVYDQMIDDERRRNTAGLLTSLSMLIATRGGFDYTLAECRTWMREAGFSQIRHEALSGPFSMMVGIK